MPCPTSGGAVLSDILHAKQEHSRSFIVSALVRRRDQAQVLASKGVAPILFNDLNDSEVLTHAASEHDSEILPCT